MSILGIAQSNHGSAAAVYDGSSLHAVQEERFDRVKWSSGFPQKSIEWCIAQAGGFNQIEAIGFYLSSANYLLAERNPIAGGYQDFLHIIPSGVLRNMKPAPDVKHIRQSFALFNGSSRKIDFYFVDHHLAHAAGAFYLSPFNEAAILVMDGTGDGYSMSLWKGDGLKVTPLLRQPFPHSLGQFYKTFTAYLGFNTHDQFKFMGLAAYGDGARYYEKVRSLIKFLDGDDIGEFKLDMRYFAFQMVTAQKKHNENLENLLELPPYNGPIDDIPREYKDLAAAVQDVTTETIDYVATALSQFYQIDTHNLVYTGGVALNCAANGRIFPNGPFENVYIPPHPADGGLAVGTAAYIKHGLHKARREYVYDTDSIGPSFTLDAMRSALDEANAKYTSCDSFVDIKHIAAAVAKGKIVGLFGGYAEFGPRALGHRSILADPRKANMKDHLNKKVKMRESFRPFAPACLANKIDDIFERDHSGLSESHPDHFMLYAYPVRRAWRKKIPAVSHIDHTSRVQAVYPHDMLHPIIEAFQEITGVPVVLNTSFNVRGEPIVLTPQDAIRCFYSTGIDCLALGPYWLEK